MLYFLLHFVNNERIETASLLLYFLCPKTNEQITFKSIYGILKKISLGLNT